MFRNIVIFLFLLYCECVCMCVVLVQQSRLPSKRLAIMAFTTGLVLQDYL